MRVADTSVLYAAFDELDPRRSAARQALNDVEPLLVPVATWGEFLQLVTARQGRAKADEAAATLLAAPHFMVDHAGNPEASQSIWEHNPKLSFVDAVGIQACLETGADLLSFDKAQLAALPKV